MGGSRFPKACRPINRSLRVDSSHHAGLSAYQLIEPFVPPGALDRELRTIDTTGSSVDPSTSGQATPHQLSLSLVTFNVLSLGKPTDDQADPTISGTGLTYQLARAALMAAQLKAKRVHVAFLQETRADQGVSLVGDYIRYASGAVRGQFGTEIWLRANHAIFESSAQCSDGDKFSKHHITVLEMDERRLLVRYTGSQISILFASLHAPHRAHERCLIESWWTATRHMLLRHARQSYLVLGGDMNAAVGSVTSRHVGDVSPEDQDLAGEHLHGLAKDFNLYLPSTFVACHYGPSYTYVQKHGGALCRPDFLAIPLDWAHGHVTSNCDAEIHAAHSTPDHIAAKVAVDVWFAARPVSTHSGLRNIRPADVANPDHRDAITKILATAPTVDWNVSVHAHAAIITDHVQKGLQNLASRGHRRPHHPYLQEATWQLHQEVSRARRELHRLTDVMMRCDLVVGFRAWARSVTLKEAMRGVFTAQQTQSRLHIRLSELCKQLKKECRRDRDRYLGELAVQISVSPSKEAFRAYHRILAHRRKKPFKLDPLCQADGAVCADSSQTAQRWREHFSALEAGRAPTFCTIAEEAYRSTQCQPAPQPASTADIPDLRRVLAAPPRTRAVLLLGDIRDAIPSLESPMDWDRAHWLQRRQSGDPV